MRASILSIGDELIAGHGFDGNSPWLSLRLAERGVVTTEMRTVGDDREAIARAVRELAQDNDVVLISGGLGPTADDLTRAALGDVVTPGRPLVSDDEAMTHLARWFKGRAMPTSNVAQTQRPEGTTGLPNPRGTAMGIMARQGNCRIFAMPGPPAELHRMFEHEVAPRLEAGVARVRVTSQVHACGLSESEADERLGAELHARRPRIGVTASGAIITAHVRAEGPADEARRAVEPICDRIRALWAPYAFGRDGETLASVTGALLERAGVTLATAESCTGGLLGTMIVDVPGSSRWYLGGWVTYADAFKESLLGVPSGALDAHGAVSDPVARAMAQGALERSGADESLAVTGIAGPDGGTADKPVGTVFVAHARTAGAVTCRRFRFGGDRWAIRDRSAKTALAMLRLALLELPPNVPLLWEVPQEKPG